MSATSRPTTQPASRTVGTLVRRFGRDRGPAALLLGLILAVWEGATHVFSIHTVILPSPTKIASTIVQDRELLMHHMLVTLWEILIGFAIGFGAGFILAVLIVYSKPLERALYPLVVASQTIPVFAIAPLLVIWFGFGIWPKVLIAALIVFFPICVNEVEGLRSVEPEALDLLNSLSATRWQIFRLLQFPASVPFLLAGTQVGIAYSVIGAVIGEWVGSNEGIGYLMLAANAMLRTDRVFASIVVLSVVALTLFSSVALVSKVVLRWKNLG